MRKSLMLYIYLYITLILIYLPLLLTKTQLQNVKYHPDHHHFCRIYVNVDRSLLTKTH